jgi:hypothetical protein
MEIEMNLKSLWPLVRHDLMGLFASVPVWQAPESGNQPGTKADSRSKREGDHVGHWRTVGIGNSATTCLNKVQEALSEHDPGCEGEYGSNANRQTRIRKDAASPEHREKRYCCDR